MRNSLLKSKKKIIASVAILLTLALAYYCVDRCRSVEKKVSYSQLQEYIHKDYVSKVTGYNDLNVEAQIKPEFIKEVFHSAGSLATDNPTISTQVPSAESFDNFIQAEKNNGNFSGEVKYETDNMMLIISNLFIIAFLIYVVYHLNKIRSGFGITNSQAKQFMKSATNKITFGYIAGLSEAKMEMKEIVDYLKQPQKYVEMGARVPKGVLLVGPAGTGKTLLARAVAGEAHVPFYYVMGSDFEELYVGVGSARIRNLFKTARKNAPCIIFIDEIDSIGRKRDNFHKHENESSLNKLLTEMDGFESNAGVVVIGASNRYDLLDKALIRSGRFDRKIIVNLPDVNERFHIFCNYLHTIKFEGGVDPKLLAQQTYGLSGADISTICNEAALIAVRQGKKMVDNQDFTDAIERFIGGIENKTKVLSEADRRTTAIHEIGHALTSWLLPHPNSLVKISIIPRGQNLGSSWFIPEEKLLIRKEEILDKICIFLGGRVAEELFLNCISSGAMHDLEQATASAYDMITSFGMSEQFPNMSFTKQADTLSGQPYSEDTARIIDSEVKAIISQQYTRAKLLLSANKEKFDILANALYKNEVMFAKEIEEIMATDFSGEYTYQIIEHTKLES